MEAAGESLASWASRYGACEAYVFERAASSHGGTSGTLVQAWRLDSGDWFTWSFDTSFFDADTNYARIDRGARLGAKGAARLLDALEATRFWSNEPWSQEAVIGVDGQTWFFTGLRGGARRVRSVWSPREGAPIALARAFLAARPRLLRWPRSVPMRPIG